MDPRSFYNATMPEKFGDDYETTRWHETPLLEAQYDALARTLQRYVLPGLSTKTRILELGPGAGTWTKVLHAANPRAAFTLVDISAEMLARAQRALPNDAPIEYVESDFLTFTSSHFFDGFFSSRALEYIPDKAAAVGQIYALLSPHAFGALITKTPKYALARLRGRTFSAFHQGQIAPRALARLLQAQGFTDIRIRPATITVPLVRSAWLNRMVYRLIGGIPLTALTALFTESYCITFRKP